MASRLLGLITPGQYQSSVEANVAAGARKTFTEIYLVLSDTCIDTEEEILTTPGLPLLRETFGGAQVRSRSAVIEEGNDYVWRVTIEYDSDTLTIGESGGIEPQAPDDRQPIWTWGVETDTVESNIVYEVPTYDEPDWNPLLKPINRLVNSAGDPINLTSPEANPVLTITRYEKTLDPDVILFNVNRVNETEFWGAPKGTAKMVMINDVEESVDGGRWRFVTYIIKFKMIFIKPKEDPADPTILEINPDPNNFEFLEDSWIRKVANMGSRFIEPKDTDPEVFLTRPVSEKGFDTPVPLAYDGSIIDPSDPNFTLNAVLDISIKQLAYADFNILNLGPVF